MCAIIDKDVVREAFGPMPTPAGKKFRQGIDTGSMRLVVGGKLLDELDGNSNFKRWRSTAVQYGKLRLVNDASVDAKADELRKAGSCASNDQHIVALAQISGARLLYSNDGALHRDFKNRNLIDQPGGKVYSTRVTTAFGRGHRRLLNDRSLCRTEA